MPTVAFDLFELAEYGVSSDDMRGVFEGNKGDLTGTLKTRLRELLKRHHFDLEATIRVNSPAERDVYVFHQSS